MAKRVTTLFIRDTSINLLVMRGKQVEKWATLPLDPGLVSQGLVVDEAQVAEKVSQLFKETGSRTSKVITAVSGHDSLYRIISMPDLPEAVLPEAVRREAKRTIPTPLEEIYFSYQRLPSPKGENRIFLVTFPRNLVDALIRTLRQAGVKPYLMDLAPLALCRIPNEPRAIIVNARLEMVSVIVLADRLPQVIRRVSLPGEAETLEEMLPLISEEFHRTIAFYNSSHREKPLDSSVPVFVCGELQEKPETWQEVVGQAGYSVAPLPSPVEFPEGFNAKELMVNIGLGLKEVLPAKEEANFSIVNFNALPEAYVQPGFSVQRVLVPVAGVVGIAVIVFGAYLIHSTGADIKALRFQVTSVEASVAGQRGEIAALQAEVGAAEAAAVELNARLITIERGRATIHLDLGEIVRLARGKVTLSRISHAGRSVTISGTGAREKDIFSYARALRGLVGPDRGRRFSEVWIDSITGAAGGFSFQLSLTKP